MLIKKAMRRLVTSIFIVASIFVASSTSAQQSEKRIALVIGNAAYRVETIKTAANDAGLMGTIFKPRVLTFWALVILIRTPYAARFAIFWRRRQRPAPTPSRLFT